MESRGPMRDAETGVTGIMLSSKVDILLISRSK